MRRILVDAGGSWTRVRHGSLRLAHAGHGRAGVPLDQSSLIAALRSLPRDVPRETPMVLGVSGAGSEAARLGVLRDVRSLGFTGPVRVVPDFYAGLFTGEGEAALLVVAGTGSVVAARKGGEVRRAGGWGPLIGDQGSGLSLGRLAAGSLAAAIDRGMALGPPWAEILAELAPAARSDRARLRALGGSPDKLARLAEAYLSVGADIPEIAEEVEAEVEELIGDLLELRDQLLPGCEGLTVSGSGGLFESELYRDVVARALADGGLPDLQVLGEDDRFAALERLDREDYRDASTSVDPGVASGLSPTEIGNPLTRDLDALDARELVELMTREGVRQAEACRLEVPALTALVELGTDALRAGGRILYAGAGTSGRLGVLDASESPPTFHTDPERVRGLIAGGDGAVFRAVEGAEDVEEDGAAAVREISVGPNDLLVGIAASGRTPWVRGALRAAREAGAATAVVTSNPGASLAADADLLVAVPTGPEVLRGSTRLGAGTAAKMVLNILTTGAWVRSGKCYGNYMVDLKQSSEKLRRRARRILSELVQGIEEEEIARLLEESGGRVKTAILMRARGLEREGAEEALAGAGGSLRELLGPPSGME